MPSRYPIEIAIIEEHNWTWRDIESAPSDLVHELFQRIQSKRSAEREKYDMDKAMAESKKRAQAAKGKR